MSPHREKEVSQCFIGLRQVETSCYEASPDNPCGSFPAACSFTRGVWSAAESQAAGLAPQGPTLSNGVLIWTPGLSTHQADKAPGEKFCSTAVLLGKGTC